MERYQRTVVNIMTRRVSPQQVRASTRVTPSSRTDDYPVASSTVTTTTTTLTCPAGTPQDPTYLTIPFTAPSEEPMSAEEPKRAKEQGASMFIAADVTRLVIGMPSKHLIVVARQCFFV